MIQPSTTTASRRVLSDVVRHEHSWDFCRETETLKAATSIGVGALVGKITADGADKGKIVPWNPSASNGSETVYGVATADFEAPAGVDNDLAQAIVRGPAILNRDQIPGAFATANATQKAAAIATLVGKMILVR